MVGPWFGGRLGGVELRWLVAEVFKCCCGGSSDDLGQRHEFRDGGELAVAGGVASSGRLCADTSGCGDHWRWSTYAGDRRGHLGVFSRLFSGRYVVQGRRVACAALYGGLCWVVGRRQAACPVAGDAEVSAGGVAALGTGSTWGVG